MVRQPAGMPGPGMARHAHATMAVVPRGKAGMLVRKELFDEWRKLVEVPG